MENKMGLYQIQEIAAEEIDLIMDDITSAISVFEKLLRGAFHDVSWQWLLLGLLII